MADKPNSSPFVTDNYWLLEHGYHAGGNTGKTISQENDRIWNWRAIEMSRDRWKGMGSVTLQSGEAVYVRDDEEQQGGERVDVMADINNISCKVWQRWNWLVHILRREHVSDNWFSALGWTPESQRVRQRSKTTWKRTIERKINNAGTWDRKCWSESVMTLCDYWHEKRWWWRWNLGV